MSDPRIGTGANTGLRVQIDQSRTRQTADTSFGAVMSDGLSRGAGVAMAAGQLAAPFIPGAAVLSAAISGVGSLKAVAQGSSSATVATSASADGSSPPAGAAGGTAPLDGAASTSDPFARMEQIQEMNQVFNLRYLELQQNMQDESRRFTVISNIMKTKHETAKNSISNVR